MVKSVLTVGWLSGGGWGRGTGKRLGAEVGVLSEAATVVESGFG